MKPLVTAGVGFTGSNLVRCFVRDDNQVSIPDNLSSWPCQNLIRLSAEFVEGAIRNPGAVAVAIQGLEARLSGVLKIVAPSSAGIFGELRTLAIREDHPGELETPYLASKLSAGKEPAYGNFIHIFVFRMLSGDGEQARDFVNEKHGARANLADAIPGCGACFRINELVSSLNADGDMAPAVAFGRSQPGDVRDSLADIPAAKRAPGFAPSIRLYAGLKEYVAWARTEVAHHVT